MGRNDNTREVVYKYSGYLGDITKTFGSGDEATFFARITRAGVLYYYGNIDSLRRPPWVNPDLVDGYSTTTSYWYGHWNVAGEHSTTESTKSYYDKVTGYTYILIIVYFATSSLIRYKIRQKYLEDQAE